jgi:hypothetical protein
VNQRWRERPRRPASPVTPGRRDGVVHAIVGRAECRCLRAPFVQEESAARVYIYAARSNRRTVSMHSAGIGSRTSAVLLQNTTTIAARIEGHHHRANDAGAVLGIVNALRFASTRPMAGPSGVDDACARHRSATARMVVDLMRLTTMLTTTSRGRMLGSFRQCRTGTPPVRHNGIRSAYLPPPPGHGFERTSSRHRSPLVRASRDAAFSGPGVATR